MKNKLLPALLLLTSIPIFAGAATTVSPTRFGVILLPTDDAATGSITLSNTGTEPASFTVTSDNLPQGLLDATWQKAPKWEKLFSSNDKTEAVTGDATPFELDIGFNFPYFNQTFSKLVVRPDGRVGLGVGTETLVNTWVNYLNIFYQASVRIDAAKLLYKKEADRLIISWQGATIAKANLLIDNLNFQLQLLDTGEIRYVYDEMGEAIAGDANISYGTTPNDVTDNKQVINLSPAEPGNEKGTTDLSQLMLVLKPQSFVSIDPASGSVDPASSKQVDFHVIKEDVDALGVKSQNFNVTVNWDNGTSSSVRGSVARFSDSFQLDIFDSSDNKLDTLDPQPISLSTSPGGLTSDTITVKNTGRNPVDYFFFNSAEQSPNQYTFTPTNYTWVATGGGNLRNDPSYVNDKIGGYFPQTDLGFEFPFFGRVYDTISISANGFVTLGEDAKTEVGQTNVTTGTETELITQLWPDRVIAPMMRKLSYGPYSGLYLSVGERQATVTWDRTGSSAGTQTFQLVLESNGAITFNYRLIRGTDWTRSPVYDAETLVGGVPLLVDEGLLDVEGAIKRLNYLLRPNAFEGRQTKVGIGLKYYDYTISTKVPHDARNSVYFDTNLIWQSASDVDQGTIESTKQTITMTTNFNVVVGIDDKTGDPVSNKVYQITAKTNTVVTYTNPLRQQSFTWVPKPSPIMLYPRLGSLDPEMTQEITVIGDARKLTGGTSTITRKFNLVSQDPSPAELNVELDIASASALAAPQVDSDADGQSDSAEILAGTDVKNPDSRFRVDSASSTNQDGSRTITWTAPGNAPQLLRAYTVWYSTNLLDGWQLLETVNNQTSYTDTEHNDVPAIYYKVTID
ncbi:MAG: hypothetical protein V2I50_04730 [Desulfuromusa sp.]|jgi:hypothetical protein|nr:hypothetical protein [Desulfuromusa sp.]